MVRDQQSGAAGEAGARGSAAPAGLTASSLTVAALIVAAGFLGSRLLGLVRNVAIAHAFGTDPELDAFWVAIRLPDLAFQLISGATLASAFMPTFARVREERGAQEGWRLASSVLNLVLLATLALAAAIFVFAPRIVPLLAPGLGEDIGRGPELQGLAVDLTRIMLASSVLFAVSGMCMGILNAQRRFLTPALAPMLYNFSLIVAALISDDVHVLAAGVVVGAALHLAVQVPDLRQTGMTYRAVASWKDAAVRQVASLMAPRVFGLAATQVNFYVIAIFFASNLGAGAISTVSFAWLIVMTPIGVIGMAISTAAFPTLAEQAARNDARLVETLRSALRLILFLSLPAGIGLALLAKPVVVVLLQRGAFDAESSAMTAAALQLYAPALFAHCGIEILSRGYYSLADTRTPVMFAVASMLLNLALAAALVGPLEVRGLALALSLATAAEFLALLFLLDRRLPRLVEDGFRDGVRRMLVAGAVLAAVTFAARLALTNALGFSPSDGTEA
ncbi:MAG TPA: murein biosynthesis integral membrane protein MurJ, partial [Dehalococcoidia bacterium]|nr:murein biosynthesis integral membrane protein MurJ [Dehalococcoidia bacterium]